MPTNLEPVAIGTQMVGVVDHPGGQPQHLALQRAQAGELVVGLGVLLPAETAFEGMQHDQLPLRIEPS